MLFQTSLVALVGMGDEPSMSPRRLQITNTKVYQNCKLLLTTATSSDLRINIPNLDPSRQTE